jgi:hypothetical protein
MSSAPAVVIRHVERVEPGVGVLAERARRGIGIERRPVALHVGDLPQPVRTRGTSSPGASGSAGGEVGGGHGGERVPSGDTHQDADRGAISMDPEAVTIAPGFSVSRIARGNWQLASATARRTPRDAAIEDMRRFVEAGITLFDCADHYVGVEELIGAFRRRHPDHARRMRVSTKLVPDLETLPRLSPPGRAASWTRRSRGWARSASTSCSSTGGTTACRATWRRCTGSTTCEAAGKVELIGTTNFDNRAAVGDRRERRARRDEPAPVLGARSAARERPGRVLRAHGIGSSATGRSRAASSASAGSGRPSRGRRTPTAPSSSTG